MVNLLRLLPIPDPLGLHAIKASFMADLGTYTMDDAGETIHGVCCAVCDRIPIEPEWTEQVEIEQFQKLCNASNLKRERLLRSGVYPHALLNAYKVPMDTTPSLAPYLLSPTSCISVNGQISVCKECLSHMRTNEKKKCNRTSTPPPYAIANGYVLGSAPPQLTALNEVELSLVTLSYTYSKTWVFFAGCHQHIRGWHTFFRNRPGQHIANLQQVSESGWRGRILVVMSGPFTSAQTALTRQRVAVRPEKVIAAFEWLKENNIYYSDVRIPHLHEIDQPVIVRDNHSIADSVSAEIENRVSVTVLFPDPDLPQPTNGNFENQEAFRDFILDTNTEQWEATLHARPYEDRIGHHEDGAFAKAFPLHFPYGYTGLPDDPALMRLKTIRGMKTCLKRNFEDVLRFLLRHRNPVYHTAHFILIAENIIRKETIFRSSRIQAFTKHMDGTSMAEKYGTMTSEDLLSAIRDVNNGHGRQFSARKEAQFLQSIRATCRHLPTSNEATADARQIYFSFLVAFGLPCIFLTVTPDDSRNYRIVAYSMADKHNKPFGSLNPDEFSEKDLLCHFNFRQKIRADYPGLCAIEYKRIMDLVIRHILKWDVEANAPSGIGCFSEVVAWCLATEEQGRKTLHGHFLLFVKNWSLVQNALQYREQTLSRHAATVDFATAKREALNLFRFVTSTKLFFGSPHTRKRTGVEVLLADECEFGRKTKRRKHSCEPVDRQTILQMRHKSGCQKLCGQMASCTRCGKAIHLHQLIKGGLDMLFGKGRSMYGFPDRQKRLDLLVYEQQKDTQWYTRTSLEQAYRLFATNALVNVHSPTHANRCFKNGSHCFANLPDEPNPCASIEFQEAPDTWYDTYGNEEKRYMFRFYSERDIEDMFMNSYNPTITQLLTCNNNVTMGMNGRAVFYVTGYQTKSQQAEESEAFRAVSNVLVKSIQKHEQQLKEAENTIAPIPDFQMGFRRILAGVYAHTNSHVVAAPMAHYLAMNGSRFSYSHDSEYLPVYGLERMLSDEDMFMRFKMVHGRQVAYHKAMDYLFRPDGMSTYCAYHFYRTVAVLSAKQAERDGFDAVFHFGDDHPLADTHVAVHRKKQVVPSFSWNWLPTTRNFEFPLWSVNSALGRTPSDEMEHYARRFMILFLPFRRDDEFKEGATTYSERLAKALNSGEVDSDMIAIAENMHTIHNSLQSQLPANRLSQEAAYLGFQTDEFDEVGETHPPEDTTGNQIPPEVLELLLQNSSEPDKECDSFTPSHVRRGLVFRSASLIESVPTPPVVNFLNAPDEIPPLAPNSDVESLPTWRFVANRTDLNRLLMQRVFFDREDTPHLVPETETATTDQTVPKEVVRATGTCESIRTWGKVARLDIDQLIAFEVLVATYVLTFLTEAAEDVIPGPPSEVESNIALLRRLARQKPDVSEPLRMFITGPAGAGKSTLLDTVQAYARAFSANIGHDFTRASIRMTAMTGVAAADIGGDTTHREFSLMSKNDFATLPEIQAFQDTRLCIVDEVSFMDYDRDLAPLSSRLQQFTQHTERAFGNVAVVFIGDFCQLEPIGGNAIYKQGIAALWEGALNCMVELRGLHRFRSCPDLKSILPVLRESGKLSVEDRKCINARMLDGENVELPSLHEARFACYYNKTRAEINAAVFKEYLSRYHSEATKDSIPTSAVVVLADAEWSHSNTPFSANQRKTLREQCNEASFDSSNRKRPDPFLCLFRDCHVMCNVNQDVINGIANGTTAKFMSLSLKPGTSTMPIRVHGYWVNAVAADDVHSVELQFHDCRNHGQLFRVFPTKESYRIRFPINEFGRTIPITTSVRLTTLPIVINHATTGHKLQGKSLDHLVVVEWSNVRNWAYVVISRIRKLQGLFLCKKLTNRIDFSPAKQYTDMMERLRKSILAKPLHIPL